MYIRYVIHILFLIEFDKTNQTNNLLVQNPCINVSLLPWHSYFYIHVLTVICTVTLWEWLYCTNPIIYFYICIKRMTFVWYLVIWSHETCFVFLNINFDHTWSIIWYNCQKNWCIQIIINGIHLHIRLGKKKINPFKTHFSLLDIFLINLITKIQRIYKIKSVYII